MALPNLALLLFLHCASPDPLAQPPVRTSGLAPAERVALATLEDATLGELRAGVGPADAGLRDDERAALRAAQERSSGLGELRAGELTLSDRDIKIILVTAAVVVLIVLIF